MLVAARIHSCMRSAEQPQPPANHELPGFLMMYTVARKFEETMEYNRFVDRESQKIITRYHKRGLQITWKKLHEVKRFSSAFQLVKSAPERLVAGSR